MKSLKGTRTAENLAKSFAGESQARMRYDYFSKVAKEEKQGHISRIFSETADNEKEHAKIFYKYLIEGLDPKEVAAEVRVDSTYPFGYSDTLHNLKYAGDGEDEEANMYPDFAEVAKEEGFPEIAASFLNITEVEKAHRNRYYFLHKALENNTLYKSDEKEYWKCVNCGYIYYGEEAPLICAACKHPQGYFERLYKPLSETHIAKKKTV